MHALTPHANSATEQSMVNFAHRTLKHRGSLYVRDSTYKFVLEDRWNRGSSRKHVGCECRVQEQVDTRTEHHFTTRLQSWRHLQPFYRDFVNVVEVATGIDEGGLTLKERRWWRGAEDRDSNVCVPFCELDRNDL